MFIWTAIRKLHDLLRPVPRGVQYWERRARQFGKRSVLNLNHRDEDVESVTQWQKSILFPLLKEQLNGTERTILDFGCGPGRFTTELARLIQGDAIGVDPIARLLQMAPTDERTDYRLLINGEIPCKESSLDAVWVCLVLGGVTDTIALSQSVQEILRVLKDGGLLFLVENTSAKPNTENWNFRSADVYRGYFPSVPLTTLSAYEDLGETITIMAGRKSFSPRASPQLVDFSDY